MTTLLLVTPYLALMFGAGFLLRALHLLEKATPATRPRRYWRKFTLVASSALLAPSLAHAQADLITATESGNAIIMYLSATFAAVGIVAAGVAMMMGRQSIAKYAFVGAMVCGLAFSIVKTMWSNMGIEASGVSTFTP